MLPLFEQVFRLADEIPQLAALGDVLVALKQLAQIQGLSAPEVAVDTPVERELEGSPVKA